MAATATTVSDNTILLHSAEKGLWYDLVHLPEFWPAGIALVVFLILLSLKRRQDRNYSARTSDRGQQAWRSARNGGDGLANVRQYCAERGDTFGGQVLCYAHQRPYLKR